MPTTFATGIALGFFLVVAAWLFVMVSVVWLVVRLVQLSVRYNNPAVEDVELELFKRKLLRPLVALAIASVLVVISTSGTGFLAATFWASTNR